MDLRYFFLCNSKIYRGRTKSKYENEASIKNLKEK